MSLYDQLTERKAQGILTIDDLTGETLEILYWNENLIKSMIADLFDVDKKVFDSKIRNYGLQLNNRIDHDLYKKISEAAAAMEQEITQRVMEKYVHKTQLYRLKNKESNRFLYPNLMSDRFRVLGRHTLLDDNGMEETIVQIESLGGAYKGGYIFVEEKDIQKLREDAL